MLTHPLKQMQSLQQRLRYDRHSLSAQSLPPVATLLPSAAQSTANTCAESNQPCIHSEENLIGGNNTSSAWPGKSMASLRVFASQTLTVLSFDADTSRRLSLDHAT